MALANAETSSPQELPLPPMETEVENGESEGGSESGSKSESDFSIPPGTGGLPEIANIQWEWKKDGAVECWLLPRPNASRRERVYLKRVGKKQLEKWLSLPRVERNKVIRQWVSFARMSKVVQEKNRRNKSDNL